MLDAAPAARGRERSDKHNDKDILFLRWLLQLINDPIRAVPRFSVFNS